MHLTASSSKLICHHTRYIQLKHGIFINENFIELIFNEQEEEETFLWFIDTYLSHLIEDIINLGDNKLQNCYYCE